MARILPIVKVVQSGGPGTPGRIAVAGNLVSSFQGKFYRQNISPYTIAPFYSSPTTPSNYSLIVATTFDVINNSSYNGRYTVYTPTGVSDVNPSSVFSVGNTEILINEIVGAPLIASDAVSTGSITNISTYVIAIEGETSLIVPPTILMGDRPIDIIGRNGTPWAESYTQNFVKLAQNFAGPSAPLNPYLGQTWYDDVTNTFNLRTGGGWTAIASGISGSNTTYRFSQNSATATWVVPHALGLVAPFVAMVQIFVDTGGGAYKMIFPSDMTFDSANQLTISFTTPQKGVVLVRA
jgi:hypothetical protein